MTAPAPTLPTDTGQLGPGTLKVGTSPELDISCYANNVGIEVAKNTGTQTTKLCGATRPGVTTYDYSLTGNVDVDLANDSGLLALSWDEAGSTQSFEFVPNNDLGVTFSGTLVLDPLNVKATEYGGDLTSDFSWSIVGKPNRVVGSAVTITGVTAGTPGSFQPSGVTPPADLAALKADPVVGDSGSNKPSATPWGSGESVLLGTGSAHWDGTAWQTGAAT